METSQEERNQWRNSPAEMVRRLTRDADRLARLEGGIRALEAVVDVGDDGEAMVHCNWVRDRLRALLDGE